MKWPKRYQDCEPFMRWFVKRRSYDATSEGLKLYAYEAFKDGAGYALREVVKRKKRIA